MARGVDLLEQVNELVVVDDLVHGVLPCAVGTSTGGGDVGKCCLNLREERWRACAIAHRWHGDADPET